MMKHLGFGLSQRFNGNWFTAEILIFVLATVYIFLREKICDDNLLLTSIRQHHSKLLSMLHVKVLIACGFCFIAATAPVLAEKRTPKKFPVIVASSVEMRDAMLNASVVNGNTQFISSSDIERINNLSVVRGCLPKKCRSNNKLKVEIDLISGASRIFLTLSHRWARPPEINVMKAFIGQDSLDLPVEKIRESSNTTPAQWIKSCQPAGCVNIFVPQQTMWIYDYRMELPLGFVERFISEAKNNQDSIVFWLEKDPKKALKQAAKEDDPDLLLFRNQAIALLDAIKFRQAQIRGQNH